MVISILRCDVIVACVWNERTLDQLSRCLFFLLFNQIPILVVDLKRDATGNFKRSFLAAGLFKG